MFPSSAKLLQFGSYEIVTPARLNEVGDQLPTGVHFKRRKRSTDPTTANISHHWTSPHAYYQISAFGQDYYLNLTLESGFIAPVYTVTILGASSEGHNSVEGEEEEDTEYQHCFYKGHVNAGQEHTAVISLCSGLVSLKYFSMLILPKSNDHYFRKAGRIRKHCKYNLLKKIICDYTIMHALEWKSGAR